MGNRGGAKLLGRRKLAQSYDGGRSFSSTKGLHVNHADFTPLRPWQRASCAALASGGQGIETKLFAAKRQSNAPLRQQADRDE